MSVSITVESIVPPDSRDPEDGVEGKGPSAHLRFVQRFARRRVAALCNAFGWQNPPWDEPSEVRGTVDSAFRAPAYVVLLAIAQSLRSQNSLISGAEGAATPIPVCDFAHFLWCVESIDYFIPVDFASPVKFEGPNNLGTVAVGSSYALLSEMTMLESAVRRSVERYGEDTTGTGYPFIGENAITQAARGYHKMVSRLMSEGYDPVDNPWRLTWSDVHRLSSVLLLAAHESIDLFLPIGISA